MPWIEFKDKVLNHLASNHSANTVNRTKSAICYLEDVIHPAKVCDVTPEGIQQVKTHLLDKGLGEHNINRLLQCLKTMMRLGEKWNVIELQDWRSISKLKAPKKTIEFHTEEEIDKLLAACPTPSWRTLVLLGTDAGLRREEMINLRWENVDLDHKLLNVKTSQNEQIRQIPMTNSLYKQLSQMKTIASNEFVNNEGLKVANQNFLTNKYKEIANAAGVSSTMQKLRQTFACQLAKKGVDVYVLSKLLGNSVGMSQIYESFMPKTDPHEAIRCLPPLKI